MQMFVEAVTKKTSTYLPLLTNTMCKNGHMSFNIFAKKMFNLFSRNALKRFNYACCSRADRK